MIKIEIPFNKDIYTEQSKLHFDTAWAKNLKTNRTNKIISIVTTLLGILILVGKNNVGGILCMIGWFGFYLVYRTNTSYKQNKKKYFEAISNEIKSRETASDHPIWELHDDYFHYKDYQHDLNFKWPAIVKYTRIEDTIFIDSKLGIRFMLSEKEVGKEKFEEIIAFLDDKIKLKKLSTKVSTQIAQTKKLKIKKEHQIILDLIASYLEQKSDQRFGQALFNLNINEFQKTTDPRNPNYNIRDIHGDNDLAIIGRIKNRLDLMNSKKISS